MISLTKYTIFHESFLRILKGGDIHTHWISFCGVNNCVWITWEQNTSYLILSSLTWFHRASSKFSCGTQIGITGSEVHNTLLCISQSCFDVSPCSCHTPQTRKLDHELKTFLWVQRIEHKRERGRGHGRCKCGPMNYSSKESKMVAGCDGLCCWQIHVNLLSPWRACQHAGSLMGGWNGPDRLLNGIREEHKLKILNPHLNYSTNSDFKNIAFEKRNVFFFP